jgi:septal ring factor EnvC (AmiA/AmiB activator)
LSLLAALAALSSGDASGAQPARPATAASVGATIGQLERQHGSLERRLAALGERARRLEAFTAARGRAYVRLARVGLMPAGAGFSELVDHAARLERLRRALERDLDEAEAVARERTRVARALEELGARRDLLETERSSLARSHEAIVAAQEREDAFERAFHSTFSADHTAVYGSVGTVTGSDADFASLKGRLPFPLAGRTEIRETGSGPGGQGLSMSAARPASARAIHRGRVAFADAHGELGRTVLVDHGDGYFSLYAGLSDIEVRVGQEVESGQVVGGVSPGGELYLELRHGKETLEPAPWFGL